MQLIREPVYLSIEHESELPIGYGLGSSGSVARTNGFAVGLTLFAAVMMMIVGVFQAIQGVVALGFLLLAEFTLVLWLQGMTIAESVAGRDPVAGSVYIVMLGVFAVIPLLVIRR